MARYNSYNKNNNGSSGKNYNSQSYSEIERFAYKMGQVKSGLNNSNSKVSDSYKAGQDSTQSKNKKPLF